MSIYNMYNFFLVMDLKYTETMISLVNLNISMVECVCERERYLLVKPHDTFHSIQHGYMTGQHGTTHIWAHIHPMHASASLEVSHNHMTDTNFY